MKLIFTFITVFNTSLLVHAQYITDTFHVIDPHEGSIWRAGEQQVITWDPTTTIEGYISVIKILVPFQQTRFLTTEERTIPLSAGKFEWTVDRNLVFSDRAALEIITDKGTYITAFTFTIEPLPRDSSIIEEYAADSSATTASASSASLTQLGYSTSKPNASSLLPQPTTTSSGSSNSTSSANEEYNGLKYTAVFIALFNLCIFLYI